VKSGSTVQSRSHFGELRASALREQLQKTGELRASALREQL
jgi:hypothetical protein